MLPRSRQVEQAQARAVAGLAAPKAVGALRQVNPPGASLVFQFDPDELTPEPGVGGWQEVQHPRRPSSTEWAGTPLRSLTFELLFDQYVTGNSSRVEEQVRYLETWGRQQPGHAEPVVLQLDYGVEAQRRYVLNGLAFGDALFDEQGRRLRQAVTVTLLEHRAVELALTPAQKATAPAAPAAAGGAPRPSGRTYTVRSGDSLWLIAQRELGKGARWTELRDLNRDTVRDPNRITPGMVLRLPAS